MKEKADSKKLSYFLLIAILIFICLVTNSIIGRATTLENNKTVKTTIRTQIIETTSIATTTQKKVTTTTTTTKKKIIPTTKPNYGVKGEEIINAISYPVSAQISNFKSYMDYRMLDSRSSPQYRMQQKATTDSLGFRRYNGDYMIALGTFYSSKCGERFLIKLDSGVSFIGVIGDIKSNSHTNSTHQYTVYNRDMIEFIVDTRTLQKKAKAMGDVSYAGLMGKIIKVYKLT